MAFLSPVSLVPGPLGGSQVPWESTLAPSWVLDVPVQPLVGGKQACHLKTCGSGPVSWMGSCGDPPRPLRQTEELPLVSPETLVWGQGRCISRWEKFLGVQSWSPSPDSFHFDPSSVLSKSRGHRQEGNSLSPTPPHRVQRGLASASHSSEGHPEWLGLEAPPRQSRGHGCRAGRGANSSRRTRQELSTLPGARSVRDGGVPAPSLLFSRSAWSPWLFSLSH